LFMRAMNGLNALLRLVLALRLKSAAVYHAQGATIQCPP
jgi:hypothetical protein